MKSAVAMLAAVLLAACHADPAPLITVNDARVVALPSSAAAYFTLTNSGGQDRLLSIAAPVGKASLHETSMAGGVMRMRAMTGGLAVPAGATVRLSPSGYHVMIEGLPKPLPAGSAIRLTLNFQRQGAVTITAPVGGPR